MWKVEDVGLVSSQYQYHKTVIAQNFQSNDGMAKKGKGGMIVNFGQIIKIGLKLIHF